MKNVFWGFALVVFGTLLLLDNLDIADIGDIIHQFWPLILVAIGVGILIKRRTPAPPPPQPGTPLFGAGNLLAVEGDMIHQSEVFSDTELALKSQNFLGGSISSIFGDIVLDLSGVRIAQGDYTLRIHSVFGDTRVILPQGAGISISANSTFGSSVVLGQHKTGFSAFTVATTPEFNTTDSRLKISISKVFGDLYVS